MNKYIKIKDIPQDINYEGYLWMSDSDTPQMVNLGGILKEMSDENNPFIVEGQLYAKNEGLSFSIRYVDGKHVVVSYDLNAGDDCYDEKSFVANRLSNVSRILFRQYWKAQQDELCEGMAVLVPAGFVFVGFEYSNKSEGGRCNE